MRPKGGRGRKAPWDSLQRNSSRSQKGKSSLPLKTLYCVALQVRCGAAPPASRFPLGLPRVSSVQRRGAASSAQRRSAAGFARSEGSRGPEGAKEGRGPGVEEESRSKPEQKSPLLSRSAECGAGQGLLFQIPSCAPVVRSVPLRREGKAALQLRQPAGVLCRAQGSARPRSIRRGERRQASP